MEILNLTQHEPTIEQINAGVIEPTDKAKVKELLTFTALPTKQEIRNRAKKLADLAARFGATEALIGGAPYLMRSLEVALQERDIQPLYSFTERKATEQIQPDGSVKKTQEFVHVGWVKV